jgi:hypothetical protein
MRISAITSRVWMRLPVFGIRELTLLPKKPNSQSTIKITMIVHNIKILLIKRKASHLVGEPDGRL